MRQVQRVLVGDQLAAWAEMSVMLTPFHLDGLLLVVRLVRLNAGGPLRASQSR